MSKQHCNFCNHNWESRITNPLKCPLCGNPVGCKPQRELTRRRYHR